MYMVCIYCNSKTKTAVVNSRATSGHTATWRRRQCKGCGSIMTTNERIDFAGALRVASAKGLQPFLRDRLFLDVHNSVSHRKTALVDAGKLTDTIIINLLKLQAGGVLEKQHIIKTAGDTLHRFDTAAGIHYTAHHQQ